MSKILEIKETVFKYSESMYSYEYEGFAIHLDDDINPFIVMGISNHQSCCEEWGYLMSQDNFDDFIGAEILDIYITDDKLNTVQIDVSQPINYNDDCIFVNIDTTKGKLQFVAYNIHNGYYSHEVVVASENILYEQCEI